MDAGEADAAIALCTDPRFSSLSPVMMAARGRRPAAQLKVAAERTEGDDRSTAAPRGA